MKASIDMGNKMVKVIIFIENNKKLKEKRPANRGSKIKKILIISSLCFSKRQIILSLRRRRHI